MPSSTVSDSPEENNTEKTGAPAPDAAPVLPQGLEPVDDENRSVINAARARGHEIERSEEEVARPASAAVPEVPGTKLLRSILSSTVFTDLFAHQAHMRFMHREPQERVQAMVEAHKIFYRACRWGDYAARFLVFSVIVGLTAFAGFTAISKTLN